MPRMALSPEEIYYQLAPLLGAHDRDAVLEELRKAVLCQECGAPLTTFCARCRGRAGGRVGGLATTPAKRKALKRNARKPRPGARKDAGAGDVAADQA
jgi:hypothetical protein